MVIGRIPRAGDNPSLAVVALAAMLTLLGCAGSSPAGDDVQDGEGVADSNTQTTSSAQGASIACVHSLWIGPPLMEGGESIPERYNSAETRLDYEADWLAGSLPSDSMERQRAEVVVDLLRDAADSPELEKLDQSPAEGDPGTFEVQVPSVVDQIAEPSMVTLGSQDGWWWVETVDVPLPTHLCPKEESELTDDD